MRCFVPMRNQKVKYYLRKWYYLDNNINHLSSVEMFQMKILYASLKTLDEDELKLLAIKYRVEIKPFKTDAIVADELNISLEEYRNNRIKIENKLRNVFDESIAKYDEELDEAVQYKYRAID